MRQKKENVTYCAALSHCILQRLQGEYPECPSRAVSRTGGGNIHEMSLGYAVINKTGTIEEKKMLAEGVSRKNCYNTFQYRSQGDRKLAIPSVSMDKKAEAFRVVLINIE